MFELRRHTASATIIAAVFVACVAGAAPARAQSANPVGVSELKAGVLDHDMPGLWSGFSRETPAADVNLEALFNPWGHAFGGTIRPAIGTTFNLRHDTSKAYADVRWEIESASGLFGAVGMGAAIHNGDLGVTDPARKALGSPVLFHPSAEFGYRFDGSNSVSLFFDHMSNGFSRRNNEGMDTLGVRLGHRFAGVRHDDDHSDNDDVVRFGGAYVGVALGGRSNESDWNVYAPSTGSGRQGLAGTGFAGYGWQSGRVVFGIEVDGTPSSETTTAACGPPDAVCTMATSSVYSVRPRIGWVIDRTMIYGTGGLAIANWTATMATANGQLARNQGVNLGVAVGVGVEHKVTSALALRAEVLHYGLQGNDLVTTAGPNVSTQFQSTTARVGMAWYFH